MGIAAIYDVPAPAKLNLYLHVAGRRADGMHLIESLMVLVDWCDTIHVEPLGADITVEKHVPWGAGLGGGSSDAASTLLALNRLWRLGWPLERLLPIGLALGDDVP